MKKELVFAGHETSPAWRYLGSDGITDYYVVNEASGNDSLTGVFSEEPGDYWAYPIHMNSVLAEVQKEEYSNGGAAYCYKLYLEQGGKYTHNAEEAMAKERKEWEYKEFREITAEVTIPLHLFSSMEELLLLVASEQVPLEEIKDILEEIKYAEKNGQVVKTYKSDEYIRSLMYTK